MAELGRIRNYLAYSERYLDKLISTKVPIKDKQGKIVKIANYNAALQAEIDKLAPVSMIGEKKLVRVNLSSLSQS